MSSSSGSVPRIQAATSALAGEARRGQFTFRREDGVWSSVARAKSKLSPVGPVDIEVKGGAVTVDQVHKLKSVIEREKALVGLFLTLERPTRPMIAEAAAAGYAETDQGRIPRLQILTVEGILEFRETPRLPVIDTTAFRKAPREKASGQEGFEF